MNVISSNIHGGLGNTMFQIATGYSTSIDENSDFIVDETKHYNGHNPLNTYKNTIFQKVKFSNTEVLYEVYNVGSFHYCEIPKFGRNIKLSGFFQSDKYFKKNRDEILSLFEPNDEIKNKLQSIYGEILKNKTCSIHVRRGDYLHLENYHSVLSHDYYQKSYEIIGSESVYLIFSDDIEYCKTQFEYIKNKVFITDLFDYEELYLMSFCDNNIIANSSFSWWGAWLNKKENIVISPKKWFGPTLHSYITDDLYSENWVII
jgi:hypothetical protein